MSSVVRMQLSTSSLLGFRGAPATEGLRRVGSAKIGGPVITGPSSATVIEGQDTTISGVNVGDDFSTTFTLTLEDTNGLLSATGTGVTGDDTTTLVLAGTILQVNTDLQTLTDTDSSLADDTINLSAIDGVGNTALPHSIAVTVVACYVRGTMIRTIEGERAIESLAIGDVVLTAGGEEKPIRWIGHRAYKKAFRLLQSRRFAHLHRRRCSCRRRSVPRSLCLAAACHVYRRRAGASHRSRQRHEHHRSRVDGRDRVFSYRVGGT